LHVLAVADVGGVARELGGDLADGAQRGGGQRAAVAPHAHHEVFGLEEVGVLVAGPRAVVTLLALGVQAHPPHPTAQILLVDAVEALLRIQVDDAGAHIERVVVLLELFVRVERLAVAERPLAFAAWAFDWLGFSGGHVGGLLGGSRIARDHRGLSGGADPAASYEGWAGSLDQARQGRQQQLHTRLKSTCRRATSETRWVKIRAAITGPIVPRTPTYALTGPDLRSA
jgi:hypothetical protein